MNKLKKLKNPSYLKNELAYGSLLFPALLLFCVFSIYPLFRAVYTSFTNWNGIAKTYQFIGFDNYKTFFTDTYVLRTVTTTLKYTVTVTIFQNLLALFMALALNQQFKTRNILRAMIFTPAILSGLIVGYIWSFLYSDPIMKLGKLVGIEVLANNILSSGKWSIYSAAFVTIWRSAGWTMMIYLAGLQSIPDEYVEAASIDGANWFYRLKKIILPLLLPAFTINVVLTFERGLKDFDSIFALTGGGPGAATMTMALNIYRESFYFSRAGYGTAIGVVLFITIVILTLAQLKLFQKGEDKLD